MIVTAYRLRKLLPPKDDLIRAIKESQLSLKNGDIMCIASKVVSIDEARCIPINSSLTPKKQAIAKEKLIRAEAEWYRQAPKNSRWRNIFTIARGILVGAAGIDESNSKGYYVLYPVDPFKRAKRIRTQLMKRYGITKLAVIITDSTSVPLRRRAVGTRPFLGRHRSAQRLS